MSAKPVGGAFLPAARARTGGMMERCSDARGGLWGLPVLQVVGRSIASAVNGVQEILEVVVCRRVEACGRYKKMEGKQGSRSLAANMWQKMSNHVRDCLRNVTFLFVRLLCLNYFILSKTQTEYLGGNNVTIKLRLFLLSASRNIILNMDAYVEDKDVLFQEVFAHLSTVEQQPETTKLDDDLLKRLERSLDASTPQNLLWQLLRTGENLLQSLQQDPRPLTRVLEKTVLLIPFDELKSSISSEKLEEGLRSSSIPIQLLCLAYLTRASDTPSGASFVAASSSLVQRLVTVWLSVESTEVSERALECIVALLAVDSLSSSTVVFAENRVGEAQGQGLMWRRIFYDPQVYSLMFLWTSLTRSNHDLKTKKVQQQVTISQGRLFDFLARVAELDWGAITTSSLPDVEKDFLRSESTNQPYGGLLRYAASNMIDSKDYLMEVLRQDFFMKLLNVVQEGGSQNVSPRLLEAIQQEAGVEQTQETANGGMHL